MATTIIIGSGGAHQAINDANTDSMTWTQAQKDAMAAKFLAFTNDVNHDRNEYNKANS